MVTRGKLKKIKTDRNPYKVMKITATIRATPEWDNKWEHVMKEILIVKFSTIPFCNDFLLNITGTRRLIQGTGDRRWGCGIPISKHWLITLKYPGKNILGHLLEEVREEIRPI